MDCLDEPERAVIGAALDFLRARDPDAARALEGDLQRLIGMAGVARGFPSMLGLGQPRPGGKGQRSLVATLCQVDSGMSSFSLPMRAVLGDAFLVAKAQLFQAFRDQLSLHRAYAPPGLVESTDREVAQTIHTMLLAELLWDLVRNRAMLLDVRQRVAMELVRLWESPDKLEVDDFFPVLEAVWRARNRVSVVYGTMVGVSELFQLVRGECPPQFVSFFTREEVSREEEEAFQEFLFGLPQEELRRLHDAMVEKGLEVIDRKFAEETLQGAHVSQEKTPEALYASYRRRQSACQLRRLTGSPGPQNTAETYMILHLLEHPAG